MENTSHSIDLPMDYASQDLDVGFSWYDYVFFSSMLVMSTLIGVYFGIVKKQSTPLEYLFGGKKMTIFPIAMSNIASAISGFTFMSIPADIYRYGINYWFTMLGFVLVTILSYYVYIPVFYELKLTSNYEYLEKRFNKKLRIFSSIVFTISMMAFLPFMIYLPALGLSQGTGISIHWITPVICGICIFYTTLGGLKAVVWTDSLQFLIMVFAVFIVLCLGIAKVGGIDVVWERSAAMGRLNVDFSIDPTKRDSFWSCLIGGGVMMINHAGGTNQGVMQKCISLPTFKHVRKSLIIFVVGAILLISMVIFTGLVMFSAYYKCDPITSRQVTRPDQILPYYIMDIARSLPGLPGVFVAGVFSAALSTLSTLLNCLAATIYGDFISPFVPKKVSDQRISTYLKILAVVIGVVCTSLSYVVEHLGSVLPLVFSISGMFGGPLVGLFTVGMLFPKVNSTGALWGGITSVVTILWVVLGSQWYRANGIITFPPLPSSVDECANQFLPEENNSTLHMNGFRDEEPFVLYKLSYYYYALFSAIIVIVVAPIVSNFTKPDDKPVKRAYLSPIVRHLVVEDFIEPEECEVLHKFVENSK